METNTTKERILAAAIDIIVEKGVGGLRMRDLARKAGIREGSIYNHFPGRETILRELFAGLEKSQSPLGELFDIDTATPEILSLVEIELRTAGLATFLRNSALAFVAGLEKMSGSLKLLRAVMSARFSDPAARQAYDEIFRTDASKAFNSFFVVAARAGLLRSKSNPEMMAELCVAALEHSLSLTFADPGTDHMTQVLADMLDAIGELASSS